VILLVLLTGALLLAGQDASKSPPAAPSAQNAPRRRGAAGTREFLGLGRLPDPAAAARGKPLFATNCGFCHGANARGGDTGPDLLRSSVVLDDNQGEEISPVVRTGRLARGMPAFPSLTEAQLADLVEFLHLQVELAANRGTYEVKNIVTGNASAGEAYFKGPGKCNTCHSATGDLAHIGSKLNAPDLQQAFLYPGARGSDAAVAKVTVAFPSGAKMTGTLKHLDDFNVSLIGADGEFHSYSLAKGVKVAIEDKLAVHRQLLDQYNDSDMHNLTAYLLTLK
jgi:cytochrome c oxidase cbb3-type subunit III